MKKKDLLSLREIQIEETKMLDIIINFLKNNKIDYYLLYGSLLGAVRHRGFIPWDDDIDIGILRKDYNKLIDIIEKNQYKINDYIVFSGFELNNSDWPYLKAINLHIPIEGDSKSDKYLYIDVFPLDKIPTNDKFFLKEIGILKKIYWIKRKIINGEYKPNKKWFGKVKYLIILVFMKFINYEKLIKKYINICSKYENKKTDYVFNNIWGRIGTKKILVSECMNIKYFDFENLKVRSFENYDEILKGWYGDDYMIIPSKERRESHSFKAWRESD